MLNWLRSIDWRSLAAFLLAGATRASGTPVQVFARIFKQNAEIGIVSMAQKGFPFPTKDVFVFNADGAEGKKFLVKEGVNLLRFQSQPGNDVGRLVVRRDDVFVTRHPNN